jgi:predicted dinucleotide-binding enzyme
MTNADRIAIIGAGNEGGNLGRTFAKAGLAVRFGVRPGSDTKALLEACGKDASASDPGEAVSWGDVVFLAVPGTVAVDVARSLAKEVEGKVVVDCNNPLGWKEGPVWTPPAEGSLAAAIAKAAPGARVVKAFNTSPKSRRKPASRRSTRAHCATPRCWRTWRCCGSTSRR